MNTLTAVGIDVSKGKSTIAVMRPGEEVVEAPYEVDHSAAGLKGLARALLQIDGEVRVVMEYTGTYYLPVAQVLTQAGLFVCVVHAKLVHDFGNNTIRRGKTDKKDAIKIANYALANWSSLSPYRKEEDVRQQLKILNRQYSLYTKYETALKNNLIALLDGTFPGLNKLFAPETRANGHEKWIDFAARFWHRDCVCALSKNAFSEIYRKWCKRTGGYWNANKVNEIYSHAQAQMACIPKNDVTKLLLTQATAQLLRLDDARPKCQAQRLRHNSHSDW